MKTITDFKRLIKVGTKIHTVYHVESKKDLEGKVIYLSDGLPAYTDKDLGNAEISIVQATQFAVARVQQNGIIRHSWCSFPRAKDSAVNGNSVTIFEDSEKRGKIPVLTYTIL